MKRNKQKRLFCTGWCAGTAWEKVVAIGKKGRSVSINQNGWFCSFFPALNFDNQTSSQFYYMSPSAWGRYLCVLPCDTNYAKLHNLLLFQARATDPFHCPITGKSCSYPGHFSSSCPDHLSLICSPAFSHTHPSTRMPISLISLCLIKSKLPFQVASCALKLWSYGRPPWKQALESSWKCLYSCRAEQASYFLSILGRLANSLCTSTLAPIFTGNCPCIYFLVWKLHQSLCEPWTKTTI